MAVSNNKHDSAFQPSQTPTATVDSEKDSEQDSEEDSEEVDALATAAALVTFADLSRILRLIPTVECSTVAPQRVATTVRCGPDNDIPTQHTNRRWPRRSPTPIHRRENFPKIVRWIIRARTCYHRIIKTLALGATQPQMAPPRCKANCPACVRRCVGCTAQSQHCCRGGGFARLPLLCQHRCWTLEVAHRAAETLGCGHACCDYSCGMKRTGNKAPKRGVGSKALKKSFATAAARGRPTTAAAVVAGGPRVQPKKGSLDTSAFPPLSASSAAAPAPAAARAPPARVAPAKAAGKASARGKGAAGAPPPAKVGAAGSGRAKKASASGGASAQPKPSAAAPSASAGAGTGAGAGGDAAAAAAAAGDDAAGQEAVAARVFPPGDPVFVLYRTSVARPVPAYFKKFLWARWCTRLTQDGACTFRGCTFVHSLSEFFEWSARSNAPPFTARKWRMQQCKLPFRAAVDAAEALEEGLALPNAVAGGIEFSPSTPSTVCRDWTQPKAPTRWLMRVAKKPPQLAEPQLAAVLCSSQHLQVSVMPRAGDGKQAQALAPGRVKTLPWNPLPVSGVLQLRAHTTKRELRARVALVFVDGAKDHGGATCTLWAEMQIRAIQPVCLYNEDADETSMFHDGRHGLSELGVSRVVEDGWDNPSMPGRVPLRPYRMPSVRVMKRAASLHSNTDVRHSEPGLFTPLNVGSYADRFHSLLCLNHASHLSSLARFNTVSRVGNGHPYQGSWNVTLPLELPVEGEGLFGVCVALLPADGPGVLALGHVTDAHDSEIRAEFAMAAQPTLRTGTSVRVWLYPPSFRYRLMHRAIEDAKPLFARLFGESATPDAWRTTRSQDLIASQGDQWAEVLATLDTDQRRVVDSLLAQSAQAVPTVVMGPFGCGKSHAIIRAILAALCGRSEPGAVLVATQTNSAADYLARAVVNFGDLVSNETGSRVLRLYATTRRPEAVNPELLKSSNYDAASRSFVVPSFDTIKDKLVVVTTCVMAGVLRSAGFGPSADAAATSGTTAFAETGRGVVDAENHFTDIIIDEAAQVWEPEALIPLSLAGERTKITLVRPATRLCTQAAATFCCGGVGVASAAACGLTVCALRCVCVACRLAIRNSSSPASTLGWRGGVALAPPCWSACMACRCTRTRRRQPPAAAFCCGRTTAARATSSSLRRRSTRTTSNPTARCRLPCGPGRRTVGRSCSSPWSTTIPRS